MKRYAALPPRLQLLADRVPQNAAFADIGTDHGLLPVFLVLRGRVRRCTASELRPEPLRRARETARRSGAAGIRFLLCDGLTGFRPEDADTIAIAGLGGENIAAILQRAPWTADGAHTLLLQPASRAASLRRFLAENGYAIRDEALAEEHGRLYPVIEAAGGVMRLSPGQLCGGVMLTRDPLGDRYLIEQILRFQRVIAGRNGAAPEINGEEPPEHRAETDALRDLVTELMEMREAWRNANCPGN